MVILPPLCGAFATMLAGKIAASMERMLKKYATGSSGKHPKKLELEDALSFFGVGFPGRRIKGENPWT
jgi:hypothetical protein